MYFSARARTREVMSACNVSGGRSDSSESKSARLILPSSLSHDRDLNRASLAGAGAVADEEGKAIDASKIRVRPVDQVLPDPLERAMHWHARDPVVELIAVRVRAH